MGFWLAALPVLVLLVLLAGLRWSAAAAGAAAAATALAAAMLAFGFGSGGPVAALAGTAAEAGFTALSILWIIFGALAIHEYQTRTGAIAAFGAWLGGLTADRRVAALFVAWFFALFLEGAAGFGTPIALAAPLLVGLGFEPARALVLVLVGHAVGVSFGAVGTPVFALLATGPVDAAVVPAGIAALHAALGWALAALLFRLAGEKPGGWSWPAAAAVAFFLPYLLIAWAVGPELPTLGGALVGAIAFVAFVHLRGRPSRIEAPPARRLAGAAAPYLVVILLILLTRLIAPLRETLQGLALEWGLAGGFSGAVAPLYHPGTMLLLGLAAAALAVGKGGLLLPAAGCAVARLPKVAAALFAVLLLARTMVHSGMVAALADAAAAALGTGWPLAAPAVGALGSFVTGSATASNLLFADFQIAAAGAAGIPPWLALIGQGAGAGIGNLIAPHNIVAGAATVGLIGGEGQVLRRTLPICLVYAAAAGVLLWWAS